MQDAKNSPSSHLVQLSGYIVATKARMDNRKKNLLSSSISYRCPLNMVNFGLLAAEIDPVVRGTPANFNGFHVLAALLHGSQVVTVSQTLRHWTDGATYVRRHLCSVGRPSRWALTHILVFSITSLICCEITILYKPMAKSMRKSKFRPPQFQYLYQFWWNSNFRTISWRPHTMRFPQRHQLGEVG